MVEIEYDLQCIPSSNGATVKRNNHFGLSTAVICAQFFDGYSINMNAYRTLRLIRKE